MWYLKGFKYSFQIPEFLNENKLKPEQVKILLYNDENIKNTCIEVLYYKED